MPFAPNRWRSACRYYANEWQGFSDEYRNAFSNYPYNVELGPQLADTELFDETERDDNSLPDTEDAEGDPDEPVEINEELASEGNALVINADNIVIVGQEVTVISANMDGQETALVDYQLDDS